MRLLCSVITYFANRWRSHKEVTMDNQIIAMRAKFDEELANASDVQTLEAMRVTYLGKKAPLQICSKT